MGWETKLITDANRKEAEIRITRALGSNDGFLEVWENPKSGLFIITRVFMLKTKIRRQTFHRLKDLNSAIAEAQEIATARDACGFGPKLIVIPGSHIYQQNPIVASILGGLGAGIGFYGARKGLGEIEKRAR